ncbi:MAG: hypothetical protein FJW85_00955 [Actinobacteria bacterium]|nr:hypothetical protein [Actinomycetota bacterium]
MRWVSRGWPPDGSDRGPADDDGNDDDVGAGAADDGALTVTAATTAIAVMPVHTPECLIVSPS